MNLPGSEHHGEIGLVSRHRADGYNIVNFVGGESRFYRDEDLTRVHRVVTWIDEPPPAEPKGILLVDHVDQLPIMPGNTGIAEEPPPAEPKRPEFADMRLIEVWVGDGVTARNVETGEVVSVDELRKRTLERYGLTEPKGSGDPNPATKPAIEGE